MDGRQPDLYDTLREKLDMPVSRAFDEAFWKKFDREFFPTLPPTVPENPWRFRLHWIAPAFAVLALVWFAAHWRTSAPPAMVADAENVKVMLENAAVIKDLELFLAPAANGAGENLAELNDEEWRILLGDKG